MNLVIKILVVEKKKQVIKKTGKLENFIKKNSIIQNKFVHLKKEGK